jgi:1-acyl-sn-glycerol-3-phosphate acyltransferase
VRFHIIRAVLRFFARAYFHLEVRGLHHIPNHGGAVIASNHPSILDGLFLFAVSPRPVRFLVAEHFYRHPLLKPFFQAVGSIEVYRTQTHNGDALRMAIEALERGELIGIFPEGTTHFGGTMQHIKQGVALLALKTGCPVIPLGIRGSREAFPPGAMIPIPRLVQLRFHVPRAFPRVALEKIPDRQVFCVLEQIRRHILSVLALTARPSTNPGGPT